MSFKSLLKLSAASVFATATLSALPAMSQQVEGEARLETVVTTAQKVEQDAQSVPISITTIADEKLNNLKAGGADIRFLSARAPSVIAESSFGRAFPRFYIRGIGNTDFDLNASQPVSLVYDDIPYESPILKGYPVFDLESVEILRGPQGTLFGRNTPGGIIKFDSVKPGEDTNGYVRASYGEHNASELEGAFGARPSDAFAFRVSGIMQRRDAFVDNAFTGQNDVLEGFEEYAARFQALISPDDKTDILFNVHARQNDSDARLFRANIVEQGIGGVVGGFDFDTVQFDGLNFLEQTSSGVNVRIDRELTDAVDVTYIYGRETSSVESRGDIDGGFGAAFLGDGNFGPGFIPFPSESSGAVDGLTQTTHELRFAYDAGTPVRGQAGFFAFDEEVDITSKSFDTLAPGNPLNGQATRSGETQAWAVFVSGELDLSDRVTVAAGARYTDEEKDFSVARQLSPFGAGPLGPISGTVGDEQISWDASISYAASEDVNLYAKAAKGFRAPSIQGRLVFGDDVSIADSETVLSYEAGVKSELFQNRVRANANVFYYTLEDQQLTIVGGLDNTVALFNADESQGYGFEADMEAILADNLLVTAGLSYNNTEIKDDVLLSPGCGAPCTVLDPAVFDTDGTTLLGYNISGNSFPNAPEWIANFTARYAIPVATGEYYIFGDWSYKGDTNFFLYDSVEFNEDAYWLGGLRAGYKNNDGVEVSVYVRNITDEIVLEGAIDFNNLTGFVNEPRTYGIEVGFDF